jgi:hypothetical protein
LNGQDGRSRKRSRRGIIFDRDRPFIDHWRPFCKRIGSLAFHNQGPGGRGLLFSESVAPDRNARFDELRLVLFAALHLLKAGKLIEGACGTH